ncbi:hypothetical protein WICPIJ_000729 [Wickerhamomyces pijperi]|uniref:NADPH-dependent 1-acyldihydroxyacetone phosphate reductase n=1 Tax=Wickerhamomyces pijperi TaxID=599730 RepID=A0A9P8QD09_WICPI|nr:hypothetical protein WICPIJ_000729 [Wickerhamomyces pijperi]
MSTETPRQKVAFVTGASSGIGYAVSIELSKRGYKVYGAARRLEPMEPLKEYGVTPVQLDVSSLESVLRVKEFLTQELKDGKLDILYNNAGQSCTLPALDVTDEQFTQAFEVNVFGPIRLSRELSKFVINAQGTFVFTSSLVAVVPFPFSSVYCATKAAISQYAHVLHLEMKGFGVRVINVITGGVKTNVADTRPLPPNSVFNFEEGIKAFDDRRKMSDNNSPMTATEYAIQVCNDIESKYDLIDVYRGTWGFVLGHFAQIAPRWLMEWILVAKFKIGPVYEKLRGKRDGVDLHLD